MADKYSTEVTKDAKPSEVWNYLTTPKLMSKWMGEPEMNLEVITGWAINTPILVRGFHHVKFENKGLVLQFDKKKRLSYTHLSSVSRLPDSPENYSTFEFILTPIDHRTLLTINIINFPTNIIRKHLEFYWRATIRKIKDCVENRTS